MRFEAQGFNAACDSINFNVGFSNEVFVGYRPLHLGVENELFAMSFATAYILKKKFSLQCRKGLDIKLNSCKRLKKRNKKVQCPMRKSCEKSVTNILCVPI